MLIKKCNDIEKLKKFLWKIDDRLPTPLSCRVEIDAYATKIISFGMVLCIEQENEIISAILFYANDFNQRKGYLSLLGTLENHEGKGYGRKLMTKVEHVAKEKGMKALYLHTEKNNEKALTLYKRIGYKIIDIDTKVYMKKEL